MNAIGTVLRDLHHGEDQLADELHTASDRHSTEHEIYHVARDLEGWSREHVRRLADIADYYGQNLMRTPHEPAHLPADIKDKAAEVVGRRPEPGLLVLRDLRTLYLMASENSLHWEMLAQAAQARRDSDLLDLVTACHPQTLRQIRWVNTLIKSMSPQILTSLTPR
jgi:hypothetical protein